MKTFSLLFLTFFFALILSAPRSAAASTSKIELPDFLSKDELAQEFAQFPREDLGPAALRSDRLQIVIQKALVGETLTVTLDGNLLYTWPTSTGRDAWEDTPSGSHEFTSTPVGEFRVQRMVKDYVSRTWQAPMPNAIFFTHGVAIHGTLHEEDLGKPASGGCVRLSIANSETLFALVKETGASNTVIRVLDVPKP